MSINSNSVSYNFNIFISYLYTKLFFNNQRLIRLPIYIRGKRRIIFGRNFTCGRFNRFDAFGSKSKIIFGENIQINDFNHIAALSEISFGDNCLIASNVFISDHNHGVFSDDSLSTTLVNHRFEPVQRPVSIHTNPSNCYAHSDLSTKPIVIGSNVWVGESVTILPGVKIGNSSIIGAGSVVTKDLDSQSIYAGNPARKLKFFDNKSEKWIKV